MVRRAATLLLLGAAIALLAQFPLDGWSEQSDLNHWIQHGLLFWSGIAVGCAVVVLYLAGKRR
jgi:hypothetical protein